MVGLDLGRRVLEESAAEVRLLVEEESAEVEVAEEVDEADEVEVGVSVVEVVVGATVLLVLVE
jgi:hypothetical protein